MANYDIMKDSGYEYSHFDHKARKHILRRKADGKREAWAANKNHASYGIIFKNTHLEYCYSL